MLAPVLFFFAALTVKQDQAALRSGCESTDPELARLPAGTTVEIRFAIADGSSCFKIAATVNGASVVGYVAGAALNGIERFEQERAAAADAAGVRIMTPVESLTKAASAKPSDPAMIRASQLLRQNQPAQAFEILEPLARRSAGNPDVLLLTGLAAYRSDQARTALDYWRQSLDLRPNPTLAQLYAKVRQEASADRSGDKLFGTRFVLRYEGQALPAEAAREVVAALDSELARISAELGCPAEEKIVAIVQSREAFLKSTGAREWAAGLYDGRIRVALLDGLGITPQTRRALAHEIVHACLTNIPAGAAPWPSWLQEGLAQKLSGERLPAEVQAELRLKARAGALPKLERLGQNWSGFESGRAQTAYQLALAAVEALYENDQNFAIRNVLNNPDRLPEITAGLDRKLGL